MASGEPGGEPSEGPDATRLAGRGNRKELAMTRDIRVRRQGSHFRAFVCSTGESFFGEDWSRAVNRAIERRSQTADYNHKPPTLYAKPDTGRDARARGQGHD
jgi:hypothetical protein